MIYNSIKSPEDIRSFLDKTNSLHDGYIVGVHYNNGISKAEYGHSFNPEQTKLVIRILVTSIWDAIVEIEFENLLEWQIKDAHLDITDTAIMFDDHNWIVWTDNVCTNMDKAKSGTYAIAKSMKWRIVE